MIPTIIPAASEIREGRISCRDLLERCLERINRLEAKVRAWVLVDPDRARAEADERDKELQLGRDRGPLHGIPVGIKDIFDVFDWPTACGSRLWQQAIARQDAPAVRRLRQAGAVLVGKTVTTQYASFDPPPTRNPWNLTRTPGGSSSGSAAAVATGMCLAALGSQTGGSITRPAAYCGVPGCKPSYGLVNLQGILPLAPSMDHPGPIAGCVHDLALVLQTIADPAPRDWLTPLAGPLRPPVLGRLRGFFERNADDAVRAMMEDACRRLAGEGATIFDIALPASFEEVVARHRVVMAVEAAAFHVYRLARHPEDYSPNISRLLEEGLQGQGPAYAQALEHRQQLIADMAALFTGLDALLCPATTRPAPDAATTGDPAFNSPWSYTGLPVVSFPAALSPDGMPLSVQLVGSAGSEGGLFQAAVWGEKVLGSIGEPPLPQTPAGTCL
jgi:aspartyl-tRNA(Asn)/glutamyl-tRNA(Gln) amidotransferase subunit A